MKINTVLFDLDGTLINSLPLIEATHQKVFAQMEIPWQPKEVMSWTGRSLKSISEYFAGEERAEEYFKQYQYHYGLNHDQYTVLYPETEEMLQELHERGYHLGVVTSKGNQVAQRSIDFLKINRYFDVIIGAQDVTRHKPHPDPVLAALDKLYVAPERAAYVGDSPYDILAGNAAGVETIGVTWGIGTRETLLNCEPKLIITDWQELLTKLNNSACSSKQGDFC